MICASPGVLALVLAGACLAASPVAAASTADDRAAAARLASEAERHAAAGDLPAAIRVLEEAERAAPGWAELKVNLAGLRSRAGDYDGAVHAARAALAIAPDLHGARFNLGLALFKSGDPRGAVDALQAYRDAADAPLSVQLVLGLSYAAADAHEPAAAILGRAVAAGARDAGVVYTLGRTLVKLSRLGEARQAAATLATLAPESAERWMLAGDLADTANDWTGAESAYRRAVALNVTFPGARYALGLMLYKQRRYDEAVRELEAELAREPRHTPALFYLASLELDRGRAAVAVPLLERLTTLTANRADAWRDLGRGYLDVGRTADAVAALGRAVALDPDHAPGRFLLGRALMRAGRGADARAHLRAAAALNERLRIDLHAKVSGRLEQ